MARVCVPITESGEIDGHWGRAPRVAIADVEGGVVKSWQEFEVGWGDLHETDTEGGHHARIARFLGEHEAEIRSGAGDGAGHGPDAREDGHRGACRRQRRRPGGGRGLLAVRAGAAETSGHCLGFAHDAQHVRAGQPGQVAIVPAALDELGKQVRVAGDIFQADGW